MPSRCIGGWTTISIALLERAASARHERSGWQRHCATICGDARSRPVRRSSSGSRNRRSRGAAASLRRLERRLALQYKQDQRRQDGQLTAPLPLGAMRGTEAMDRICIRGGIPLEGVIPIGGAKNAALPLMAASLLTPETLILKNVPV